MKILPVILGITIMISACEDVTDNPEKPAVIEELPGDVSSFFEEAGNASQMFTIDAGEFQIINGEKGGVIYINALSLVRKDGSLVDEGTEVDVELIEIYSAKDMVLSNKPTVSDGKPLVSGGELYFNITENGEDLELAPGKSIFYQIPADIPLDSNGLPIDTDMLLFVGQEDNGGSVNWTLPADTTQVRTTFFDQNEKPGYSFEFSGFGWINCDKFYNDPRPKTDVIVNVPDGQGGTNTAVYLILKDELLVNGAFWSETENQFGFVNFPVGLPIYIVGIAEIEGDYYFSMQEIVIEEDHVLDLEFAASTLADIEQSLEDLDN